MGDSPSVDVFDLKKIRRLVELMKEHDLNEMDLEQGEQRIRLRRAGSGQVVANTLPAPAVSAPAPAPPTPAAAAPAAAADDGRTVLIKSPMVGTFYAAPSPEAASYVKVGDHVGPDTTICIVEAMKVFNEIPAETSGKIVAVLVENGDPVEYGQPLFKVDTSV
ncbi:MAG: acetyl-CoA carboxylase biotin carboxyl carrier protein [Planctomycetales bacterium]|nr:acetyl-CoA carboxylase biotin carboxyl carrier protein [Planctomycetales bacterium]NIM09608.1 acetyl-CoA carboxylase biotin carboxyl carrier protein [Planctomycetales bacterium]NIN09097.1 acetyl-CoA carboxylase biotin carboxyl carrier protein [Planctomycetales bacterium]NIN78204.1 acetyl-CoA carboxylase biotin carboxyl carrier protein [Planctomycetales bacterium]NIO35395.1 acetyl-CoA carboxylase biotin carboxyl carrier protein [Planctomycetales bacterium]